MVLMERPPSRSRMFAAVSAVAKCLSSGSRRRQQRHSICVSGMIDGGDDGEREGGERVREREGERERGRREREGGRYREGDREGERSGWRHRHPGGGGFDRMLLDRFLKEPKNPRIQIITPPPTEQGHLSNTPRQKWFELLYGLKQLVIAP